MSRRIKMAEIKVRRRDEDALFHAIYTNWKQPVKGRNIWHGRGETINDAIRNAVKLHEHAMGYGFECMFCQDTGTMITGYNTEKDCICNRRPNKAEGEVGL